MSDTSQSAAETVTSHDGVVVRRALARQDGGLVGTLRIEPTGETPVTVHVVDEFPATLPIDEVGFRPDAEPESGEISTRGATVTQPVDDEPVVIEYGLELDGEVSDLAFDSPTIRDVVPADGGGSPVPRPDGGEQSSANAEATTGSDGSSSSLSSMIPRFGGGTSEPDDADSGSPAGGTGSDSTPVEPSSDAIERAIEEVDPDPEAAATPGDDAGAEASAVDGVDTDDTQPSSDDTVSTGDAAEAPRRSVDLRLDRLSARVEEFATYATALEDLIDAHGHGATIVDRVDEDLDDLESRVESLRDDLETVEDRNGDALDALREQADDLEAQVEATEDALSADVEDLRKHVHDEVSRLDTGLANQGAKVDEARTDVDALEGRVAGVEDEIQGVRETVLEVQAEFASLSDDVEAMRDELTALRTEVGELAEVRESLADVFDPPSGDEVPSGD